MRRTVPNFLNFTSSLLMLFSVQPLSGNSVINYQLPLHSYRFLIKILSSLLNDAIWQAVWGVIFKICVIFSVWFERRKVDKKKQTYMKTEACILYSGAFRIFLPNVIKIDLYNFELYRFKVCAFFLRHSVFTDFDEPRQSTLQSTMHNFISSKIHCTSHSE